MIQDSLKVEKTEPEEFLNKRREDVDNHRSNESVSDRDEPPGVEIGVGAIEQSSQSQQNFLLGEVGVDEEHHDGVQELRDEYRVDDVDHLLRLGLASCLLDDEDGNAPEEDVDDDDDVLQEPVERLGVENLVVVEVANGFLHLLALMVDHLVLFIVVDSLSELLIAKTLLSTKRWCLSTSFRFVKISLNLIINIGVLNLLSIRPTIDAENGSTVDRLILHGDSNLLLFHLENERKRQDEHQEY